MGGFSIINNIGAINALNRLNQSNAGLSKTLERLSSGLRINSAADDASGLAIADGLVDGPRIMACGRWLITTGDSNDLPAFWWWGITAMGSQRFEDGDQVGGCALAGDDLPLEHLADGLAVGRLQIEVVPDQARQELHLLGAGYIVWRDAIKEFVLAN